MKHKAFTLVEMLVVVAVIAVLVALLAPSLSVTKALARTALCASNLRQLDTGFQGARNQSVGGAPYPVANSWPTVPRTTVNNAGVFLCPAEADADTAPGGRTVGLVGLRFRNSDRSQINAHFVELPNPYIYRYGSGESAHGFPPGGSEYEYYVIEDNIADGAANANSDRNDGLFRLNLNSGVFELLFYSCVEQNQLFYNDAPLQWNGATGTATRLPDFGGAGLYPSAQFGGGSGISNYGINKSVGGPYAPDARTIVLLDFKQLVADPDPARIGALNDLLRDPHSARHRGRLNVLFVDHSVSTLTPSYLDYNVSPQFWRP